MFNIVRNILARVVLSLKKKQDKGASTFGSNPPRTKKRASEYLFDFQHLCIFCGQEANEEEKKKDISSRITSYHINDFF